MGFPKCLKDGAGDGTRTRDVQLGKSGRQLIILDLRPAPEFSSVH